MSVHAEDLSATSSVDRPRFAALRRWWLEATLPGRDSDLTVAQWKELVERYVAAGGKIERLEALIEVNVKES